MKSGNRLIQVHGDQFPDGLNSPDVYFTPGYGRAASVTEDGKWILLEAFDGAWQMPLIVRSLIDGSKDAISPYGYSGVYASPALSSAQLQEAWPATIKSLSQLGVISVLLRHSPLVPQAPRLPGQRSIITGHPTRTLELINDESAWAGMEGRCRTAIRKALKNGYSAGVRQATSPDLAPTGDFRRLYEATMRRRDASSLYLFSDTYYGELLDGLGSNLIIAEVRDRLGEVVSSTLLMRHARSLHYHLSGSGVDAARMGTNNLMLWTAIQYGVAQALRQFHLGGGVDPRDALFRFKRSFGGYELDYGVSGLIIDPKVYREHTERRARECDTSTDALLKSNFFPAYRGGKE